MKIEGRPFTGLALKGGGMKLTIELNTRDNEEEYEFLRNACLAKEKIRFKIGGLKFKSTAWVKGISIECHPGFTTAEFEIYVERRNQNG